MPAANPDGKAAQADDTHDRPADAESSSQALTILAAVSLAGLVLVALGVTVVQWAQWAAVPAESDWQAAAAEVESAWTEGDAFVVEPEWDSRPRVYLETRNYIPAREPTWFDLRARRIWLLSESGREDRGLRRLAGWSEVNRTTFGSVTLIEAAPPADDPTRWDALSALEEAQVHRQYGARREDCKRFVQRPTRRFHCRRPDPFLYVGESLEVVTNDVHRCLWAMPIDQGGTLHVKWDTVPMGGTLSGHYGQTIDAVRSTRGAPIDFAVLVGDEEVYREVLGLHDEGFRPWTVDTSKWRGGNASVEFQIHAASQLDRFFCFTARTEE